MKLEGGEAPSPLPKYDPDPCIQVSVNVLINSVEELIGILCEINGIPMWSCEVQQTLWSVNGAFDQHNDLNNQIGSTYNFIIIMNWIHRDKEGGVKIITEYPEIVAKDKIENTQDDLSQ